MNFRSIIGFGHQRWKFLGLMVLGLIVVLILFILFIRSDWESQENRLHSLYGIDIEFERPVEMKGRAVLWDEIDTDRRARVLKRLKCDLSKYDKNELNRYVSRIYVFDQLTIDSNRYGGTYDVKAKTVYIQASLLGDTGDTLLSAGLHHEVSSLLLYSNKSRFDRGLWASMNNGDFRYDSNDQFSLDIDGSILSYKAGFASEYGMVSVEEDFNTVSQLFVAKPDLLLFLAYKFSGPLAKKQEAIFKFYKDLNVLRYEPEYSFRRFLFWRKVVGSLRS